jgi:DNA-binding XRE family transcriptional regulator
MSRKRTNDALKIIDRRYFRTSASRAELETARETAAIARQIQTLRIHAGLTQRQLAARIGTTHTAVSRLENDDYRGHSLSMLRRIATALGRRVEVRFVPVKGSKPVRNRAGA